MRRKGKVKLNRITIMIEEPIQKKIRKIQARELIKSNKKYTFSQAVNRLLEKAL